MTQFERNIQAAKNCDSKFIEPDHEGVECCWNRDDDGELYFCGKEGR